MVGANYHRYLEQVDYVDTLVGQLRKRLEPIWADALVVLVADHGVAFEPKQTRRAVTNANLPRSPRCPYSSRRLASDVGGPLTSWRGSTDVFPTIGDWLGTGWKGEAGRCGGPSTATR